MISGAYSRLVLSSTPMLMRRLRARNLHSAVAVVFALLAVLSPLGDALAFGLHDHIAGPGSGGAIQWSAPGDPNLKPAHHCELSMSPIGLALAPETPLLCSSAPMAPAPPLPAPLADLFVPLSPPRA